jgi:hypothetical protein
MRAPGQKKLFYFILKLLCGGALVLSCLFVLLLVIFLGSVWRPGRYAKNVKLGVLDLDGGAVGAALLTAAASPVIPFTCVVKDPASTSLETITKQVDAGNLDLAWVATTGASAALSAGLQTNSSVEYMPSSSLLFIYDEGRAGGSMSSILELATLQAGTAMSAGVAMELLVALTRNLEEMSTTGVAFGPLVSAINLTVLRNPLAFTTVNLHPIVSTGVDVALGLAYIDYWVVMLACACFLLAVMEILESRNVRRDEQNLFLFAGEMLIACMLSLWPPVLVASFGHLFDARPSLDTKTFFIWWAWLAFSMYAFLNIITQLLHSFGEAGGMVAHALLLVVSLVSSSAFEPASLMHPFFRIGMGLPLANSLQGSRWIVFGSYDRMGRNIGVMFAWLGVVALISWRRDKKYKQELKEVERDEGFFVDKLGSTSLQPDRWGRPEPT